MGEANEFGKSDTIENGYPRDLLQRFMAGNSFVSTTKVEEEDEETEEGIELNLGLSLGGCFGVNQSEKTRLVRSSSIAGLTNIWRDEDISLIRTCSLPVPNEDEKRKRKELQSLRRLEAKRKRSEKQRNWKLGKDRGVLEGTNEEDKLQHKSVTGNGFSSAMGGVSFRPPTWGSNTSGGGGGSAVVAGRRFPPPSPPPSQPAGGLQRSTSSGVSEIESRQIQGLNNCFEARSSMNVVPELAEQKPVLARTTSTPIEKTGTSSGVKMENPSNDPPKVTENGSREMGMKMMEEMPCVTTTGNGPNGKRIEGFLYKYRKGEEVRIVCVCHGSFLSPAEFVKHAGGGDVENPLRHITISQSSSTYV